MFRLALEIMNTAMQNMATHKVAVFSLPKDENVRNKLLRVILRVDFTSSRFGKVCNLHFHKKDIILEVTNLDKSYVSKSLKRPCLKVTIPHIFPAVRNICRNLVLLVSIKVEEIKLKVLKMRIWPKH